MSYFEDQSSQDKDDSGDTELTECDRSTTVADN